MKTPRILLLGESCQALNLLNRNNGSKRFDLELAPTPIDFVRTMNEHPADAYLIDARAGIYSAGDGLLTGLYRTIRERGDMPVGFLLDEDLREGEFKQLPIADNMKVMSKEDLVKLEVFLSSISSRS